MLLVIVMRPLEDPLPTEYRQLLEGASTQRLRLGALALVCQRLGVAQMPEPVAARQSLDLG